MSKTERRRNAKRSRADYITAAEAAKILGVTARSVARHCKDGHLSGAIMLSGWIIPRRAVERFTPNPVGRPRKGGEQ